MKQFDLAVIIALYTHYGYLAPFMLNTEDMIKSQGAGIHNYFLLL